MSSIFTFFHSLFVWPFVILIFSTHAFLAGFVCLIKKRPYETVHKMSVIGLRMILSLGFVQCHVRGADNIPKHGPFILMANHQSVLDIAIVLMTLPRYGCFIAKKELKYIPILGQSMIFQGHFFIDRSQPREAIRYMSQVAKDVVERDIVLIVFPEGTRSKTGRLGELKLGSFKVATEQGIPIIPCFIKGADAILPRKKLMFRPGHLEIEYGVPIPVEKQTHASKAEHKTLAVELAKKVESSIRGLGAR